MNNSVNYIKYIELNSELSEVISHDNEHILGIMRKVILKEFVSLMVQSGDSN